ncbi:MAG: Gfo/Idh/MocA family oxidoreductase [Candidatus Omnitrophica bacterium]|nr:Gfo/Idh/MocA family oxidoreductase [Candidatus Omnitrophota bacterium]
MNNKVKIGIIGCGNIVKLAHLPSLSSFEDVEICGVCDIDEKKLVEIKEKYKIVNTFNNYKEMIEKLALDAVYIALPPHIIFDPAIDCLERKLNIFIEKPPGICKEQTRQMALKSEKFGCITMVGFQRRFSPLTLKVKELVERNGPVILCIVRFIKFFNDETPYFRGAIDLLTSDIIHAVDCLRWIGGEVKKVSSLIKKWYKNYENNFNAILEFESGATGLLVSNYIGGKRIFSIELHAKGITAYVEPEKIATIFMNGKEECISLKSEEIVGSTDFYKIAGFYNENRHFIDCLKQKKQPLTNLTDALKTMELIEKIYYERL